MSQQVPTTAWPSTACKPPHLPSAQPAAAPLAPHQGLTATSSPCLVVTEVGVLRSRTFSLSNVILHGG